MNIFKFLTIKNNIMYLIRNILSNLAGEISNTKLGVLSQICKSVLCCSNKITMLETSRYTKVAYRTVQRFFAQQDFVWEKLNLALFKKTVWCKNKVFLLASDEVVEKKAGKKTYGLSHFFSNIEKQPIPSVAFMNLSIVDTEGRKSYPIATKQVIKPVKEKQTITYAKKGTKEKRPKGRPKGSKNKPKTSSTDIQYIVLESLLKTVILMLISCFGKLFCTYLTLDGYFGNQYYMRLAKSYSVDLISKLKSNSALYFPFQGQSIKKGRPKKYGSKVNTIKPSAKYLVGSEIEGKFSYNFYQMQVWSKPYTDAMLNVVVIICRNNETGRTAHCILFSTDLKLSYDKIVEYYKLRFQIEFNFRDAKQYFGLADFKNYKEVQLTNAVNLSFFMCNLSYILIKDFKERFNLEVVSILDLKAYYRTEYIANKAVNLKRKGKNALLYLNPMQIFDLAKNQAVNF